MLFIFSCQVSESEVSTSKSQEENGFQMMKDSIEHIYHTIDFSENTYENDQRMKLFKTLINESKEPNLQYFFRYAIECLNFGNTQEAVNVIQQMQGLMPSEEQINKESLLQHKLLLDKLLAICYLRLAEQSNCIHNHNDESCIIPLEKGGFHEDKTGSELAIEKYTELLEANPLDYESRWLLNIAYMTLGMHPDEVPAEYLITLPKGDAVVKMNNIATRTGLDHNGLSGGVIVDDFNNDHLLDIIISSWGFEGSVNYFQNDGKGGFLDKTNESGLSQTVGGLNIKQADYDNDGNLDFFILRGSWKPNESWGIQPNSLIKNNGDGTFQDVTFSAGLYSRLPTQSAEWFDFNQDGWLDLFIANETTRSSTTTFPCELYVNNGDGTFTEKAASYQIDLSGYFKGVTSGDINNDGWPDLFLSNLDGVNVLLLNQFSTNSAKPFRDITELAGVQYPHAAFPSWFFDFNNDGWEDIFVASFGRLAFADQAGQFAREMMKDTISTEACRLYLNNGDNTFTSAQEDFFKAHAISTMGCNYGDIDNDGYPDIYLGTGAPDYRAVVPNRLLWNIGGKELQDQTFALGVGHIQKGHGIAFGDLNNDGTQDIYAVMGGAFKGDKFPNAFFENEGIGNNWVKLKLLGSNSNLSAIGARLKLSGRTNSGKERIFYQKVSSGASFGANPLLVHFGLGQLKTIDNLEVMWPSGSNEYISYGKLELNTNYILEEGHTPVEIELRAEDYKKDRASTHHHMH